ncbi:MAG: hypothetical protein AB2689_16280 [Candidatus Thiodiazotropha taylori]
MDFSSFKQKHDLLTLLVAFMAVVLSQFPPIYKLFYAPEIEIRKESSFFITPNVYQGLTLGINYSATNVGEEPGRIREVYLFITNDSDELLHAARANYFKSSKLDAFGAAQWEILSEIALMPGKNWSHLILFNREHANEELDDIRDIQDQVKEERREWEWDMEDKGYNINKDYLEMPEFKISKETLDALKKVIEKKVNWLKIGTHNLIIVSFTGEGANYTKYKFQIDEIDLKNFARSLGGYVTDIDGSSLESTRFGLEKGEYDISDSVYSALSKIVEVRGFEI